MLLKEGRLILFHGPDLLNLLRQHYIRASAVPTDFTISSDDGWLRSGNVHIGVVKGACLKALHNEFGEALFFENIRDFLGVAPEGQPEDRSSVNEEISETIRSHPERMLERNNGIVLRAAKVATIDANTLRLTDSNIVNGCQTTMCLALSPEVSAGCRIAVKVVETSDAWDITKSANSQNQIRRIELEFAKYLRPQLLRKAANDLGYGYAEGKDASAKLILNAVYRDHVDYEEVKSLYLGLFSTRPGNIFSNNYVEVRYDVIEQVVLEAQAEKYVFDTMFLLARRTQEAVQECEAALQGTPFVNLFRRFFNEEKPAYRVYFSILAVCAATANDISDRDTNTQKEAARTYAMIRQIRAIVENRTKIFGEIYKQAFLMIAESTIEFESEREIQHQMYNNVKRSFKINYQRLQLRLQMSGVKVPVV